MLIGAALESSTDNTISADSGLSRQTSTTDHSFSSLTRRRSVVQTPGVATRNSQAEGHRIRWRSWRTPQIEPEQEAQWRVNPSHAPSQNQLAALDLAEDGSGIPTIRAQTPGDMEYCQLGTFKLGTLSVINGAPSPVPSTETSMQTPHHHVQEDYFPTVDSGPSPSPLATTSTSDRGHARSKSSILPTTTPLYRAYQLPENEKKTRSNLRHNVTNGPQENCHANASSQSENTKHLPVSSEDTDAPQNAITLAQEYQAGIPSSPFKKRHELDDKGGFQRSVSEDSTPSSEAFNDTILDEPLAMTEVPKPVELHATSTRSISQRRRNLLIARPPPRSADTADTADSGYSSGSSLKLTHQESRESQPSTATAALAPTPQNRDTVNVRQRASPTVSILKVPSVQSRYSLALNEPTRDAYQRPASLQISSEILDTAAPNAAPSPMSARSAASSGSSDSASPKSPKRLQKRRKSQTRLPVVQTSQSIRKKTSIEVPEVPVNVQAKFTRRLSQTPGVECLTSTFASTEHVIPNEFVDDFPDPTPTEFINQLAQSEPRRTPTPPPLARRRSSSRFRKKKTAAEDCEAEQGDRDPSPTLLDLGTIASALGCSPYDAAMSGSPKRTPTTAMTHPHQLGNAFPRTKSMVKMDAETAAELARIRSKDRAAAEVEMPRPQRRRKSLHNLKLEAGEGKASKRSLRNTHDDIPPVPSIDTAKLQIPHTAMPRLQNEDRKTHKADGSSHGQSPRAVLVTSEVYDREHQNGHYQSQHDADWEAHSRHWREHQRRSIGDGLRARTNAPESNSATVNFRTTQASGEPIQQVEEPTAWDRYSGGLNFAYEGHGAGVGGSAGTRQAYSHASPKSMQWKHQYGVDLSDVPVFLQRA